MIAQKKRDELLTSWFAKNEEVIAKRKLHIMEIEAPYYKRFEVKA